MKSEHRDIVDYLSVKIAKEVDEYLSKINEKLYAGELISILVSIHITSLFNLLETLSETAIGHKGQIQQFMDSMLKTIKLNPSVNEVDVEKTKDSYLQ